MTQPTSDISFSKPVNAALAAVDRDSYVYDPDGSVVPQSSSDRIIATLLDQLDVQPGMTVLEIGTGSGYSTALLAHLVGTTGHVASIDIDPALVTRASNLLEQRGFANTSVSVGNGGHDTPELPSRMGLDRIIAWTTADYVPSAWINKSAPGAVIVTPVQLSSLAVTQAIVRLRLDVFGQLSCDWLSEGGFVPMHDTSEPKWGVPPRNVDALVHDTDDNPWWLSAHWIRHDHRAAGEDLLRQLITERHTADSPLTSDENPADFHLYLTATQPGALTTAALGEPLWQIGHTRPGSAAFIPTRLDHTLTYTGDFRSVETLASWAHEWRELGRPGYDRIEVFLRPQEEGWSVRTRLPESNTSASSTSDLKR